MPAFHNEGRPESSKVLFFQSVPFGTPPHESNHQRNNTAEKEKIGIDSMEEGD